MNRPDPSRLIPRKAPRQRRSEETVAIIRTATIQVLLNQGLAQLTTTRVAERAGVSVGTMYQYFPNKQALLFAIVEHRLGTIEQHMLGALSALEGAGLAVIAHGIVEAWLDVKLDDLDTSRVIYAVGAEFDLSELIARATERIRQAIANVLEQASDARFADCEGTAFMMAALVGGSVRAVLEQETTPDDVVRLRRELPIACHAYLAACSRSRAVVHAA